MGRLCLAFADGQGFAFEISEVNGVDGKEVLGAWFRMMRAAIGRAVKATANAAIVRFGRLTEASKWGTVKALHDDLRELHPIRVDAGFEGNAGVEGGAWRPMDGSDDGLVHLRFAAGTEDLPLHVHEFSDRLLVVTSGLGLFHYLPDAERTRELRSVVVDAGDAVLFTRGVVHTFTAPLGELTLLSYHAPFFEFNDTRQFTIPESGANCRWAWRVPAIKRHLMGTLVLEPRSAVRSFASSGGLKPAGKVILRGGKQMKISRRMAFLLPVFIPIANSYVAHARASGNDSCASATVGMNGTPAAAGDNCTASVTDDTEASCTSNSSKDLWFLYTATCNGTAQATTEGSSQSDTVLSAYSSCGGLELACNDDSGTGFLSQIAFSVNSGASYWIRLASYGNGCGGYSLNISCVSPICGNDVIEQFEVCDGIDTGSCEYGCAPNCKCVAPSPDINSDFSIDLRDVAALYEAFGSTSPSNPANLDGNESVGLTDFGVLFANLTGPLPCQGLDGSAFRYSIPAECLATYNYALDLGYAVFEAGRWCEGDETVQEVFTASLATAPDAVISDRVFLVCAPEQKHAYLIKIGPEGEAILFNGGGGVRIFEDRIELLSEGRLSAAEGIIECGNFWGKIACQAADPQTLAAGVACGRGIVGAAGGCVLPSAGAIPIYIYCVGVFVVPTCVPFLLSISEPGPCDAIPDDGACDDGTVCTVSDECSVGVCWGGDAYGGDCTTERADLPRCVGAGIITRAVCRDGKCVDDYPEPCADPCSTCPLGGDHCVTYSCNDFDHCTRNYCDRLGGCRFVSQYEECADQYSDACVTFACNGFLGGCFSISHTNCDDGDACTRDWCNPQTGCYHQLPPDRQSNACVTFASENGQCVATYTNCDDGDACTVDSCNRQTGCYHELPYYHQSDACTTYTSVNGQCVATDMNCDDGNPSTTDRCNRLTGCLYGENLGCESYSHACYDGCSGLQLDCDDGDACTRDHCNPQTGCYHLPFDPRSDACVTYASVNGLCIGTYPCDDGDSCTDDFCNGQTGCYYELINLLQSDACRTFTSMNGQCVATDTDCDDEDICTLDWCNPQTGCHNEFKCSGDYCCDDSDPCTIDTCVEVECLHHRVPGCK